MSPGVILNAFADSLKIWRSNPQKWVRIFTDSFVPLACRLHTAKQASGFETALDELLFFKPEVSKSLKENYNAIVSSARIIDDKVRERTFPSVEKLDFENNREGHWISDYLTAFEDNLTSFEQKIRRIAKLVTKELASEKPAGTGQGNDKSTIAGRNGDVKKIIRPTIEKIVEIIEKLKTLQAKVVDLINKKSIVPDDKVSKIVEKLSISSKIQQKEEAKDNIAGILKLTQQAEITKMQREGSWPEDIKQLMNEIEKLLFPYLDYLEEKGTSGKWEQAYIEYLIKLGIPSKLDEVLQELEKIKYKIEVESQQSAPDKPADTEQNEKPGGKIKTKDKPGRPKVSKEKAQERRKIKSDWERLRDTIKGANKKKKFCDDYEDADITVEYLNNSVLRWCRDHPK